jgi:hypothetical protein
VPCRRSAPGSPLRSYSPPRRCRRRATSIGIFTSIFTAITVTRLLVALWLRGERAKSGRIEVPI